MPFKVTFNVPFNGFVIHIYPRQCEATGFIYIFFFLDDDGDKNVKNVK